jgi:hypothetical protein
MRGREKHPATAEVRPYSPGFDGGKVSRAADGIARPAQHASGRARSASARKPKTSTLTDHPLRVMRDLGLGGMIRSEPTLDRKDRNEYRIIQPTRS